MDNRDNFEKKKERKEFASTYSTKPQAIVFSLNLSGQSHQSINTILKSLRLYISDLTITMTIVFVKRFF